MKTLPDQREARNPIEEGVSMLPYIGLYQRMHRRRWSAALIAGIAAGAWAAWRSGRRRLTR